jgi:methyltransferase (TIGR00027 family)
MSKRLLMMTAGGFLSALAVAGAVEPGKPSKTAIMAAVFRAIGARNPDSEFRNPDFLAGTFLRIEDLTLLAAAGADYRPQMSLAGEALSRYLLTSVAVTTNFVRTVHIDRTMQDAVKGGATQVVVLGAGLDSRAYRFRQQLPRATFFEVDFPPTQAYKTRRVRQVLGRVPSNVRYVPMDFTKDDLQTRLAAAGYVELAKTIFIWEGVVAYIPEPAVRETLRFVARHSAAGSSIIFDYPFNTNHRINNPNDLFAKWGEPFVFGFPTTGPTALVSEEGLRMVSDLSNADLVRKYAMHADGTSSLRTPVATDHSIPDDAGFAVAEVFAKSP